MLHNPVYRSVQFILDEFSVDQQCGCHSVEHISAPGAKHHKICKVKEHIAALSSIFVSLMVHWLERKHKKGLFSECSSSF